MEHHWKDRMKMCKKDTREEREREDGGMTVCDEEEERQKEM